MPVSFKTALLPLPHLLFTLYLPFKFSFSFKASSKAASIFHAYFNSLYCFSTSGIFSATYENFQNFYQIVLGSYHTTHLFQSFQNIPCLYLILLFLLSFFIICHHSFSTPFLSASKNIRNPLRYAALVKLYLIFVLQTIPSDLFVLTIVFFCLAHDFAL